MSQTIILTGMDAIDYADSLDGTVCVRGEANGVDRDGVSLAEAEEIATENPDRIYLVITGDEVGAIAAAEEFLAELKN